MNIKVLSSEVADQIAAGEVVERPSSVVKELVENSLDAGATNVVIRIENGGKDLIEVQDDGTGMTSEDAEKSVLRHATSKIASIDDLFSVNTFGFRGEALAAISSVSEFTLLTKKSAENFGMQVHIHGGKDQKTTEAPANTGTTITIKNLFFPTPARLKHLKNPTTEFGHIFREVLSFVVAYPHASFEIWKDDKQYRHFPATDQIQRVQQILDKNADDLVKISADLAGIKLHGYVIKPGLCERTKKHQFFLVNHRRIEDYRLAYAVREAYVQSAGIEKHLHPSFVLFIDLDPILVDVNVHPRKLEVKFSEPNDVFQLVKNGVMNGLQTQVGFTPNSSLTAPKNHFSSPLTRGNQGDYSKKSSSAARHGTNYFTDQLASNNSFADRHTLRSSTPAAPPLQNTSPSMRGTEGEKKSADFSNLKLIGQIANKYIAAESSDGMYFFDQHALHERQRFEQFWNDYQAQKSAKNFVTQKLLIPETIKLPLEDVATLFEPHHQTKLTELGFVINLTDDEHFDVQAVPQLLEGENLAEIFQQFAETFTADNIGEHALDQFMRKKLEYKSCRGAVMFGDPLEPVEMQKLLDDFGTTQWRNLCPHGRPNHWHIPFGELDQRFHR